MTKTLPKFSKDITFIWFIIKGHLYKPSEIDRVSFILFGSFFLCNFFLAKTLEGKREGQNWGSYMGDRV